MFHTESKDFLYEFKQLQNADEPIYCQTPGFNQQSLCLY